MTNRILEIYKSRELILNLARKDFNVRYKTATLGFLWAFLNPLLMMIVLSIVFSFVMRIKVDNYPAFLLIALIPWTFFSLSVSNSTSSIVDNGTLIKKVYFPREVIPISINMANLINFVLSFGLLLIFLIFMKIRLTPYVFLIPFIIAIQLIFNIGFSLITSSLHVYYRDVKYLVEATLILWFYATPIFYPIEMVPERFQRMYMLNPMADIVTLYRSILLRGEFPSLKVLLYGVVTSLFVFILGFIIFRRHEPNFADAV